MVGACVALTACDAGPTAVAGTGKPDRPTRAVDFDFEHEAADNGAIVPSVTNAGTARVTTSVATATGGRAVLVDGVEGGYGLRFPAFSGGASPPAAAVVIRAIGAPDVLSPGEQDFSFGADFALDRRSDGVEADNGNNLLQRGLSADTTQYKLQVDHGVPSCRVSGADGVALAVADAAVVPERWYRATCARSPDRVVLVVVPWTGSRWGTAESFAAIARTGKVDFVGSGVPLSIGAKVDADGSLLVSATDQFNGVVDNVHFEVAR
jgi:hypothetical protein